MFEQTDQGNACYLCGNVDRALKIETNPSYPLNEALVCLPCHYSKWSVGGSKASIDSKDSQKFCCDICGRRFRFDSFLQRHKKIHSEVKEFMCTKCGRNYKYRGNLNVHLKVCSGIPQWRLDEIFYNQAENVIKNFYCDVQMYICYIMYILI